MTAGALKSLDAPSADLASVCGLFCGACSVYLATREDPARLARLAERLGQTVDETRCDGCRADPRVGRRARHCRTCRLAACASVRGLASCGACPDHPCPAFAAYDLACRACGHAPGSPFAADHGEALWTTWGRAVHPPTLHPDERTCHDHRTLDPRPPRGGPAGPHPGRSPRGADGLSPSRIRSRRRPDLA